MSWVDWEDNLTTKAVACLVVVSFVVMVASLVIQIVVIVKEVNGG